MTVMTIFADLSILPPYTLTDDDDDDHDDFMIIILAIQLNHQLKLHTA